MDTFINSLSNFQKKKLISLTGHKNIKDLENSNFINILGDLTEEFYFGEIKGDDLKFVKSLIPNFIHYVISQNVIRFNHKKQFPHLFSN